MEDLLFSLNIILPMVLLMAIGWFLKHKGIFDEDFVRKLSFLCYRLFLPVSIFKSLYGSSLASFPVKLAIYAIVCIFIEFFVALLITHKKTGDKRGVMIQGMLRSNYAYIGMPLASQIFADSALASETIANVSLMAIFFIPMFNVLSTIGLAGKEGTTPKKIGKMLIHNPIINAVLGGVLVLLIRKLFPLTDGLLENKLSFIYKVITYLGQCATPLALLVVGAGIRIRGFSDYPNLLTTVGMKIVVFPLIFLSVGAFIVKLNGPELATLIAAFGSPVAVSSAIIAKEMGGDGELAGNIVALSTAACTLTIFIFLFVLKNLGVLQ